MAALTNQCKTLVNDSVKDALGKAVAGTSLDTTSIVSLGKALNAQEAFEPFFKSLANRITKTVYFVRSYTGRSRNVLRDEAEFGAYKQKVYYDLPEAVDNEAFKGMNPEANTFTQASPYDVTATIPVSSLIFGGKGTWAIEFVRPVEQIKEAFLSNSAMMSFIDGLYIQCENAFKLEEERLVAAAVNTSFIVSKKANKARNLLAEYNTLNPTAKITSAEAALRSADFLKFASKEINKVVDNFGTMSTIYNAAGYATFTPKEQMVVEMLSEFADATDMYLQADVFHNELTALPNYEKVPFWQYSGANFEFKDTSSIKITHNDLGSPKANTMTGIICSVRDKENVAAYFGDRHSWDIFNPRSDVMVHGEKATKGFAVDKHANAVVFYVEYVEAA